MDFEADLIPTKDPGDRHDGLDIDLRTGKQHFINSTSNKFSDRSTLA